MTSMVKYSLKTSYTDVILSIQYILYNIIYNQYNVYIYKTHSFYFLRSTEPAVLAISLELIGKVGRFMATKYFKDKK